MSENNRIFALRACTDTNRKTVKEKRIETLPLALLMSVTLIGQDKNAPDIFNKTPHNYETNHPMASHHPTADAVRIALSRAGRADGSSDAHRSDKSFRASDGIADGALRPRLADSEQPHQ